MQALFTLALGLCFSKHPWSAIYFDYNHRQSPLSHLWQPDRFIFEGSTQWLCREAHSPVIWKNWWKEINQVWNGSSELFPWFIPASIVCTPMLISVFKYLLWATITFFFSLSPSGMEKLYRQRQFLTRTQISAKVCVRASVPFVLDYAVKLRAPPRWRSKHLLHRVMMYSIWQTSLTLPRLWWVVFLVPLLINFFH